MLKLKASYLIATAEDEIIHKSELLSYSDNRLVLEQIRTDISELLASRDGIYLFSDATIKIEQLSIVSGEVLDALLIDQSYSLQLKNMQAAIIPIRALRTLGETRVQHLTISGFDLMDTELQLHCDILELEGKLKLFPNFKDCQISIAKIHPSPRLHYMQNGECSELRVERSFIDRLKLQGLCVGSPPEIIGRVFKAYRRRDNQELLVLIDSSIVGSLDIHELELHGPNTTLGIYTDATSKILNIEISDNTKIKNRLLATDS